MPADGGVLTAAVAAADRAYANRPGEEWALPFFAFTRSLSSFRQGHFDEAITRMRTEAMPIYGAAPGLVVAMSLEKTGRHEEALEAFASRSWNTTGDRDTRATLPRGRSIQYVAKRRLLSCRM